MSIQIGNKMGTILAVLTLLYSVEAIKIYQNMLQLIAQYFWHHSAEATPFHFRIEADHQDFQITLNHHDGSPLVVNKRTEKTKKIDSYASVTGQYFFCIQNMDVQPTHFTFNFYQGLELSDLASLPKQQDSKLIDELVDKINEMYQKVTEQQFYSHKVNEYNMQLQKLVSFKSVGFVFLSVTVVFVISFLHYLEIKRVLKNRKII